MTQGPTKQDIGNQINDSENKATPADADKSGFWDTVGLKLVYLTFLQLKDYLKAYFDTIYSAVNTAIITYYYGTGSDGAATLDGTNLYSWCNINSANVYAMVQDAYLTDLTINNGVTLQTAGFRIFGTGTLTNNGTIQNDGGAASGFTPGNGSGGGPSAFYLLGLAGGAGVASGAAAADGSAASASNLIGGLGGRGASAWATAAARRGRGSFMAGTWWDRGWGGIEFAYRIEAWLARRHPAQNVVNPINVGITPGAGGGGGGKSATGTSCNSGSGGGGGGIVGIAFRIIVNGATGIIRAAGGAGGNAAGTGANAGGGGGGGGGIVWIMYSTLTNNGTINAPGGVGGTSVALGSTPKRATAIEVTKTAGGAPQTSQAGVAGTLVRLTNSGAAGVGGARNTLYVLAVAQRQGTLNNPTVVGWGLTWNFIASVDYDTIGIPTRRLCLFYAYGTPDIRNHTWGPYSSDVLITYSSAPTYADANLIEVQNATGTIVQNVTNRKDNTATATLTVTLAGLGSTDAAVIGVFGEGAGAALTVGAGFTSISSNTAGQNTILMEMSYNDTTVDAGGFGSLPGGGIAIEVQAIAAMENGQNGDDGKVVYFQNSV